MGVEAVGSAAVGVPQIRGASGAVGVAGLLGGWEARLGGQWTGDSYEGCLRDSLRGLDCARQGDGGPQGHVALETSHGVDVCSEVSRRGSSAVVLQPDALWMGRLVALGVVDGDVDARAVRIPLQVTEAELDQFSPTQQGIVS